MRKTKRLYGLFIMIMSIVITCLSFGVFSSKDKIDAETAEVANAVSANGGALYVGEGSTLTLGSDSKISGITGATNGGAIYVAGTLIIDGATIENCSATNGGAIYVAKTGVVTMNSGTISDCSATYGGAIYNVAGGQVAIKGGTISGCSATTDGGAISNKGGTLTISGGTMDNCSAVNGGIIYNSLGTTTISGGEFKESTSNYGGAIYVDIGSTLTVSMGLIENCTASYNGGAIYSNDATVNIETMDITGCEATTSGGAIFNDCGTVTIDDGTFDDCLAKWGGFVYMSEGTLSLNGGYYSGCSATNSGGAVYAEAITQVTIQDLQMEGCSATNQGGAIIIIDGPISLYNVTLDGNTAANGGAIYCDDSAKLTMSYTSITNCSATYGGAIYTYYATVTFSSGYISGCSAVFGGGIYIEEGSTVNISGGNIYSNTSRADDGANISLGGIDNTLNLNSGSIYSPVTGNNIFAYQVSVINLNGATIGNSTSPESNDRVYMCGQFLEFYYTSGTMQSIVESEWDYFTLNASPTNIWLISGTNTKIYSATTSYLDLTKFASYDSGYAPILDGNYISLAQSETFQITVVKSGSGVLTVDGTTQTDANKVYSINEGSFLLLNMTLSASTSFTQDNITTGTSTTYITRYSVAIKNSSGKSLYSSTNIKTWSVTVSYTYTPTADETLTVTFSSTVSEGLGGLLFMPEDLETQTNEELTKTEKYFDNKKYLTPIVLKWSLEDEE